jgi:hypothetical protein
MKKGNSKVKLDSDDIFHSSQYDDINDLTLKTNNFGAVDMLQVTLKLMEKEFQSGNKYSLMAAIYECAKNQVALPEWVAEAYVLAFTDIHSVKFKSWDDVFDKPFKGQNTSHILSVRNKSTEVIRELQKRLNAGDSLTSETYEAVAEKMNTNRELVKEIWKSKVNF